MATEPKIRLEVLTNDQFDERDGASAERAPKLTAGSRLLQAREQQGISVAEVAQRLRLLPWMIEALEKDDYERLSAPIFARGYIRNYASTVGVSEDEIMRLYDERRSDTPAAAALAKRPVRGGGKPQNNRPNRAAPWVGLVLLLGLLGLMSAWWFSIPREEVGFFSSETDGLASSAESADLAASADSANATTTPLAVAPTPVTAARDTGRIDPRDFAPSGAAARTSDGAGSSDFGGNSRNAAAPGFADSAGSASATSSFDAQPAAAPEGDVLLAATQLDVPVAEAAEPVVTAPADGLTGLSLRFSRDSWAEVRDARGKRLVYELGQEGNTVSVRGRAPFRVFLGFAPGVELELNGQPYDIAQHARPGKTTARFRVGEGS